MNFKYIYKTTLFNLKNIALHFGIITALMLSIRLVFYTYNQHEWADTASADLKNVLLGGLVFDATFALVFTLVFAFANVVLYGVSKRIHDATKVFIQVLYLFVGSFFVSFAIIDIGSFSALKHHIIAADLPLVMGCYPVFFQQSWFVIFGAVGLLLSVVYILKKLYNKTLQLLIFTDIEITFKNKILTIFAIFSNVFSVIFILFRLGCLSISPIHATNFATVSCLPLAVNQPYLLLYSALRRTENLAHKAYFDTSYLEKNYPIRYDLPQQPNAKNVVVILIESLSRENVDNRYAVRPATPFMDSIRAKSWVFDNAFSNGLSSNEGVASVVGGIPPLLSCDYAQSPYIYNKIHTIGHKLVTQGYSTIFLSGWRNLGYTTGRAPQLFGMQTVLDGAALSDADDTEAMGLYDGDFMPKAAKQLKTQKQPFYSVVFNVSTHYNYTFIPKNHPFKTLNSNDLTNNKAVTYFDGALQQFFTIYQQDSVRFRNTIFVFVADHHSRTTYDVEKSMIDVHKIPLWIYTPDGSIPAQHDTRLVEQTDLPVSILKMLGVGGKFMSFGQPFYPVETDIYDRYTVNKKGFVYQIADVEYVLQYDGLSERSIALYHYSIDKTLKNNILLHNKAIANQMENELKARIQRFNNTIIENKMADAS